MLANRTADLEGRLEEKVEQQRREGQHQVQQVLIGLCPAVLVSQHGFLYSKWL